MGETGTAIEISGRGGIRKAWDPSLWDEAIRQATAGQSAHTRAAYRADLEALREWLELHGEDQLARPVLLAWVGDMNVSGLSPATINRRLSALRRLIDEAVAGGYMAAADAAAMLYRVKGPTVEGTRSGNWLALADAQRLLEAPDVSTMAGLRDRAALALMLGGGVRRDELARLEVGHVAMRDGRWVLLDLVGKRRKVRTVPIGSWVYVAVREWLDAAGIDEGRILRPVNRGGRVVGESMTASALWYRVRLYARRLGVEDATSAKVEDPKANPAEPWRSLAPHDLRRTYAKLAHRGGAKLEQIQLSLGHGSIQTTERYLGVDQDLTDAPCDHLGLSLRTW